MSRFVPLLAALLAAACGGGSSGASGPLVHAAIVSGDSIVGRDVAIFPDGSTLVTGEFTDIVTLGEGTPAETTVTASSSWAMFVARYAANGAFLWVRVIETRSGNGVRAVALADGGLIVTGTMLGSAITFGTGEPTEATFDTHDAYDSFVARYAADGDLLWVKRVVRGFARDLALLLDSSVVVVGDFSDDAVFAPSEPNETTLPEPPGRDLFVARYDLTGALLWVRTAGSDVAAEQQAAAVAAVADGCIVTGYVSGNCTFGSGEPNEVTLTTTPGGASGFFVNPFVARWAADGSFAWARKVGAQEHVSASAIDAYPDGSSVITGRLVGVPTVFGPGEPNETTFTHAGLFVARYGPMGDLLYAKHVRSPQEFNQEAGVAALPDGSALVTGTFYGEAHAGVGEPNEILLVADHGAFLARFGRDGLLAWAGREANASSPSGRAVETTDDDGFIWIGDFDQEEGLELEGTAPFPPRRARGLWIARYRE